MEAIIAILVPLFIVGAIDNAGYKGRKREGSRKGFGVGYDRGRRAGNQGRLVMIALLGLALTATTVADACLHRGAHAPHRIHAGSGR